MAPPSSNDGALSDARGSAPAAVQASVPVLPTGGGAIRGIGEKLSTRDVTGTAAVSIPLPVSPSRGAQPALSLAYDSGAGNGPFGAGWQLSLPRISRKTERRLPTYRDGEDVFVLSGAEDLVPVGPPITSGDTVITRYRPRVEEAFARIEQHRSTATGESWWVTTTADNVRSVFGRDAAARVADPTDARRVFAWLLERTDDALGNVMTVDYVAEDTVGAAMTSAEEHRRRGAPIANRYPKRVRYGNTVPGDAATAVFEVVFDYGDHDPDAPAPAPDRAWPARADAFSSYRAGFEIRTYRRCARVLVFHAFAELGAAPCLVRSLALGYDDDPALGKLVSAELRGHVRNADGTYAPPLAAPALRLAYTTGRLDPTVHALAVHAAGDLGGGLADGAHQWVDLDAEGLAGVLTDGDGGLFYRRNLGGGVLGPPYVLAAPTHAAPARGAQQLLDVDGDGRLELVAFGGDLPGVATRIPPGAPELVGAERDAGSWEPFRPLAARPNVDWAHPSVRFLDLDGDGRDDLVLVDDEHLVWYPSLGRDGFGPPRRLAMPRDDERTPAVVFRDPTTAIAFTDLDGDGLRELVRVENGRICYWPNLGHGRFGAMVTMASAPVFDRPELFSAQRILFHDIDGSGTTDVIYAGADVVRYWPNLAGNAWGAPVAIALPPDAHGAVVTVTDLLGTGTACLVWSSALPTDPVVRYVDLLGGVKPHLLGEVDNQLGLVTRTRYAPSTKFYLADRAAGRPWTTRIGFVVHVVERVESYDSVRRVRFVSEYAYRDGYYDGHEREFRGFGRVERRDTESPSAQEGAGLFPDRPPAVNDELPQPPVVTTTWFHTGAWLDRGPDRRIEAAGGRSPAESRDAYRALRGRPLRSEVRCDDGSPRAALPYTITEHGYAVRRLVAADGEHPGVFYAHERETITRHIERAPEDPRVQHAIVLDVDDLGHVRRSVAIAYPRAAVPDVRPEQRVLLATLVETDVVNEVDEAAWYRHGAAVATRTYELTGLAAPVDGVLAVDAIRVVADAAVAIAYDAAPPPGAAKRLVEHGRVRYLDSAAVPAPLPFGRIDARGLVYESYGLAHTDALVAARFAGRVTDAMLGEGGYVRLLDDATGWWAPSGRAEVDPARFFLPVAYRDPFGSVTTVAHDAYLQAVVEATDARGNATRATLDYRTLAPALVTDPNGNQTRAETDALGRVAAVWFMGDPSRDEGDRDEPSATFAYAFFDPATGAPSASHGATRERHRDPATRWQHAYTYSDGVGAVVLTKVQAEPGAGGVPRWLGNGRTVFDNKGNAIRTYEPYFSATPAYEPDAALAETGVASIMYYDPVGRLVRTEHPNGTIARVEVDPWRSRAYDANDAVTDAGNRWLAARQPGVGATPADTRAAALAVEHAHTPTTTLFDVVGRAFAVIADNGARGTYETRTTFDIEGNPLVVTDPLGRAAMTTVYSLLGVACASRGIDAGARWMLVDVNGAAMYQWGERGFAIHTVSDALRRPIETWVDDGGGGAQVLVEAVAYGEDHPDPVGRNLRGRAWRTRDGAGERVDEAYDFRGNLLASTRRLAADHRRVPDWSGDVALETEVFRTETTYDALGRAVRGVLPDGTVLEPRYGDGGALDGVAANLRGAATATPFVDGILYNERRQRSRIVYGAAAAPVAVTDYAYDPRSFRMTSVTTRRTGATLQDLAFTYDAAGNVVEIGDAAQATVFFAGAVVDATQRFAYEPVYRLARCEAREHAGGFGDARRDHTDAPVAPLPHPNDGQALRRYAETYTYDAGGNLVLLEHAADGGAAWRSPMQYAAESNRLVATMAPGDDEAGPFHALYAYDAHGNMTAMPHLARIEWDWKEQMRAADTGGGGQVFFTYDGSGARVRKVWEHGGVVDERIYVGAYEVYRRRVAGRLDTARETVHVMDDTRRIAMVETLVVDDGAAIAAPVPRVRYQLGNHLGSVALELDATGRMISYEEYHPFGTSAYRAAGAGVEVSARRYRYTGKERDEETGLGYHGARYYAPWLARWTACDPTGLADGLNVYAYCGSNPVVLVDPNGAQATPPPTASTLIELITEGEATLASEVVEGGLETAIDWELSASEARSYETLRTLEGMATPAEAVEGVEAMELTEMLNLEVGVADAGAEVLGSELAAAATEATLAESLLLVSGPIMVFVLTLPFCGSPDLPAEPKPKPAPNTSTSDGTGGASPSAETGGQEGSDPGSPEMSPEESPEQACDPSSSLDDFELSDAAAWSAKAHGNSYRYIYEQWLYAIVDASGEVLKYGTTQDPATRYTPEQMRAFGEGAHMEILSHGDARRIRDAERKLIERYGIVRGDEDLRPPKNKCKH